MAVKLNNKEIVITFKYLAAKNRHKYDIHVDQIQRSNNSHSILMLVKSQKFQIQVIIKGEVAIAQEINISHIINNQG